VHPFTAVRLQAEALAYSYGESGVLKYLALLPQINEEYSVKPSEAELHTDPQTEFCQREGLDPQQFFCRCWLHTCPNGGVGMSASDIYRMYKNRHMFAIVISPINEGLKALCLKLTEEGYNDILGFESELLVSHLYTTETVREKVVERIGDSDTEYIMEIPFQLVLGDCQVVDLRLKTEITAQISKHITEKSSLKIWSKKIPKEK